MVYEWSRCSATQSAKTAIDSSGVRAMCCTCQLKNRALWDNPCLHPKQQAHPMAQISPALDTLRRDSGLYRELDVLDRLQHSLPDGYEVFHSVAWQTAHHGEGRHGEIDLVVLAPSGNILLVEVKAGELALIEGNLVKLYGQRDSRFSADRATGFDTWQCDSGTGRPEQ